MPYRENSCGYSLALPKLEQDYQCLDWGAMYWLVIPDPSVAQTFTAHMLSQAITQPKAVLVAQGRLDKLLEGTSGITALEIKPQSLHFLKHLTQQLDRALAVKKRLLLLYLEDERPEFWQPIHRSLLRTWRNWLEENQCTLVVVASGSKAKITRSLVLEANASVAGFASLYPSQSQPQPEATEQEASLLTYRVAYWRNALGVKAHFSCGYRHTKQGFDYLATEQAPASVASGSPFEFYKAPWYFKKTWWLMRPR